MSPAGPIAVVVSCGVHLVLLGSLGTPPEPPRLVESTAVEVELRAVQAEAPSPPPPKREAPAPVARRKGNAPAAVPVTTFAEVEGPVEVVVGGVPGDGEPVPGGSGGTDERGAVVTSPPPPPPPPPDTSVELLSLPRVPYPEHARADGIVGRVRLWVQLDETGRVLSVEVLDEPGAGLGDAARKALLSATFKPPTHLGRREATAFEYVYRFQLL